MNLKLVVASMSILGLISCPVFAAHQTKHKKMKHQQMAEHRDYKDMGSLPVQEPVCTISQNSVIMDGMTQSYGRSMPNPCNPGWFNRIQFSGGVNVDIGKFGNRNANIMGENYQRFSLNDAYLNLAADISDWTKAFASIGYNTATMNSNPSEFKTFGAAEYSAAYSNNINATGTTSSLELEQAYATIGNFDVSPVFVQVGKGFQPFSSYEIHPITASMTQVMSEVLTTALKLGFIANGFNGSVYAFDDPIAKIGGGSSRPTNYGASLGYSAPNDQLGWDAGAGYLYNIIGANDVAYSVVNFTGTGGYNSRVGGAALFGDVNSGPFILSARYTAAIQRFNVNDLTKNGFADLTAASSLGSASTAASTATPVAGASGAKPWAAGIQGGYGFDAWGKNQNVYLGYQTSREAAGLNLPKNRWLVGYGIDMFKNTHVGVEWDHDMAYNASNGGSGNNTNLVSLRSSVKFG
ncbi:MAG: hypothetical protein ACD_46C00139G0012 [uncultured bacterium]|nr:MAG: hypothetical protein ACD_46C00139G0012 [uncultured bacterium]